MQKYNLFRLTPIFLGVFYLFFILTIHSPRNKAPTKHFLHPLQDNTPEKTF